MTGAGPLWAGVDLGSSHAKAVVIDADRAVRGRAVRPTGTDLPAAADRVLAAALAAAGAGREAIRRCVATGFGRARVDHAAGTRTEIACLARAGWEAEQGPCTVVDVGGQDTKIVRVGPGGRHLDFRMNRACAAGTGAFLEEIGRRLGIAPGDLEHRARAARRTDLALDAVCSVFAASEALSRLRDGVPADELARAAVAAVVRRVLELAPLAGPVRLAGGVAEHLPIFADLLAARIPDASPDLLPHPQSAGAWGAALLARDLDGDRADPRGPGPGR